MSDWKIRRLRGECAQCERAFETDGERILTQVRFDGDDLVREDYHPECWEEPIDAIFWWATRFAVKAKSTRALDFELIERLFFQLEGRSEEKVREVHYLLCLMLMRKRRLKLVRVERGQEGEAMIVRQPRRKKEWRVFVYDFEPERIEVLRGELATLLDGELEGGDAESSGQAEGADEGRRAAEDGSAVGAEGTGDGAEDPAIA
jgi:hypothetical protein